MSSRVPHPTLSLLNPMVVPTSNQLVQMKRFDSSTSISTLDSGRGSSMGSRWSSVSSVYSNTGSVSSRAKDNWVNVLKKLPQKLKPKKTGKDKHHALGGTNFSSKALPIEGAAQPESISISANQDDFDTQENRSVPKKSILEDDSGRRNSSSSSSLKSFHSGSSNDSKETFYNLDTSGHNPTDYYTEARTDVETTTEPLTDASHANVDHESTETLMNNMTNNYYIQDLMMSQGDYATNNFEDNVFDDQY